MVIGWVACACLTLGAALPPQELAQELAQKAAEPVREAALPAGARLRLGSLRLRHAGSVSGLAFTPDGGSLLSLGDDGMLRSWQPGTGEARAAYDLGPGAAGPLALMSRGAIVAVPGSREGVALVTLADGAVQRLSPDLGQQVLALPGDGPLLLWRRAPPSLHLLDDPGGPARSLTFIPWAVLSAVAASRDGALLAIAGRSAGRDRGAPSHVAVFRLADGDRMARFDVAAPAVDALAFSADGAQLLAGLADGRVVVLDLAGEKQARGFQAHQTRVTTLALSPDGGQLVSGSASGTLGWWDARTDASLRTVVAHGGGVAALVFSPDGRLLASAGGDQRVRLWDVATGAETLRPPGHRSTVSALAVSANGSVLVTGSHDGTLRLWDPVTGAARRELAHGVGFVQAVACSPDGSTVLSGGHDGWVRLWDAATGEARAAWDGRGDSVLDLEVSPDGRRVAAAHGDGVVRVWDLRQGGEGPELELYAGGGFAFALAWSPTGDRLATGTSNVRWFTTDRGSLVRQVRGTSPVADLCWSPDGSLLACAQADRSVRLLDPASGSTRVKLEGHAGRVRAVAFSPDGRTLASAGFNETGVRLWSVVDGRPLGVLAGHEGAVLSLAYLPDGDLASAGMDGTALVWNAPTGTTNGARPEPAR